MLPRRTAYKAAKSNIRVDTTAMVNNLTCKYLTEHLLESMPIISLRAGIQKYINVWRL